MRIGVKSHIFGVRITIYPKLTLHLRLIIVLLFLLSGVATAYNRSRAASYLHLADLPALSLEGVQRILVVSPHPDDETIGAGGLIQAALARGLQVKVVMVTNGDGQQFAPLAINGRLRSNSNDYIAMGERRQVEALAALERLGLSKQDTIFLGYPDRGLLSMWLNDWGTNCPIRALYTKVSQNPYASAYTPQSSYCGSDLLADMRSILADYLPDFIVIPHPNDDHSDHRAAANFAWLALAMQSEADPDYIPSVWGYLVHYGHYPQPRGNYKSNPILPPIPLAGAHNNWVRLDLEPDQIVAKHDALTRYPTQVRLLGSFLTSFARRNEIFVALPVMDLSPLEYSSMTLAETGVKEIPYLSEPSSESTGRMLVGGADLVGWHITRLGDTLLLTASTRGNLLPGLQYRILIKSPTGETQAVNIYSKGALTERSFTAQIDLAEIGAPPVLGFSAEIRQGVTLDRTGWSFVVLRDWLP